MSLWSAWKNFVRSFGGRSTLTAARRQHILQRHRRALLEPLEGRQLMAALSDQTGTLDDTTPAETQLPQFQIFEPAQMNEHGPAAQLAPDID